MIRRASILFFVVCAVITSPAFARKCGEAIHRKGQEKRVILLQDDSTGPAFYARFDRFVLYFPPELLVSIQGRKSGRENQALLAALRGELPLKQDFDLFSLAVNRISSILRIEELVSEALDAGRGRFRDMYRDSRPRTPEDNQIVRVSVELGKSPVEAREYCDRSGALLFFVIDGVEN